VVGCITPHPHRGLKARVPPPQGGGRSSLVLFRHPFFWLSETGAGSWGVGQKSPDPQYCRRGPAAKMDELSRVYELLGAPTPLPTDPHPHPHPPSSPYCVVHRHPPLPQPCRNKTALYPWVSETKGGGNISGGTQFIPNDTGIGNRTKWSPFFGIRPFFI